MDKRELLKKIMKHFRYDRENGQLIWIDHWCRCKNKFLGNVAGSIDRSAHCVYRRVKLMDKSYRIHKLIWLIEKNQWTDHIDHINGNGLDNRIINLRSVNHRQNHQNKKCHRNGHVLGTHRRKDTGRWQSQIYIEGVIHRLGQYDTAKEAHNAYLKALKDFRL